MRKDEKEKIRSEDALTEFLKDPLRGGMIRWDDLSINETIKDNMEIKEIYLDNIKNDIQIAITHVEYILEHISAKDPSIVSAAYELGKLFEVLDDIRISANRMKDD